ncbi:MAG: hypothetical protein Q8877_03435 [Sweet potato little leaf phytoplasma]|nr:hypothetical protein [Sweet potato little leaf phytoplasma]
MLENFMITQEKVNNNIKAQFAQMAQQASQQAAYNKMIENQIA